MPPKSKACPKAELLTFLLNKNRPYSATNLVDEMHGEYTKGVIQKAIDALVDEDKITCKLCGKSSKLYFAKQDGKEVATKEQLVEMDKENQELEQKNKELIEKRDELMRRRDELAATRTMDDLRQYRIDIEKELEEESQKRDELIKSAEGITPEDGMKSEKEYGKKCAYWYERKKLCMDIVNQLLDSLSESPRQLNKAQLMEEADLETDEQYHVNLEKKIDKHNKKIFVISDV